MASNPPFQVEDTDEDFFDKLVDDVDDYKVTPLFSQRTNLADGSDSDDAKVFASLGISNVGTGIEDSGKVGKLEDEEDIKAHSSMNGDVNNESTDTCIDPAQRLVSSSYFAFGSASEEPKTEATELEEPLDSAASWNHGPGGAPGVKVVQWTAFTEPVESGSNGFGSYNDFFSEFGDNSVDQVGKGGNLVSGAQNFILGSSSVVDDSLHTENVNDYSHQFHEVQANAAAGEQSTDGQDLNSSQYWENLYPGWKYDANTGQWYQVNEGYDAAANVQGEYNLNTASECTVSNEKPEVSYLQQTVQSAVGAVAEKGTNESVTSWNPVSQGSHTNESLSNWDHSSQENNRYPSHMIFDPRYPGWYYDMTAQEWCSLDAYNSQQIVQAQDQVNQNGFSATNTYFGNDKTYGGKDQLDKQWKGSFSNVEQQGSSMWQPAQDQVNQNGFSATNTFYGNDQKAYGGKDQLNKQSGSEVFSSQGQGYQWKESFNNVERQGSTMWQPDTAANRAPMSDFGGNKLVQNHHGPSFPLDNHVNQQQAFDFRKNIMSNQSGQQASYASSAGRPSAGRPPHALVTFGFGGKLIVMKDSTTIINSSYGNQDSNGRSISVLNLAEVSTGGIDVSSSGASVCDYFHTLGRQSFPGPLAGGNVGGKELNKWIDERITHSESSNMDYRREALKLLLSLLKIASQQYGKLRSPFGADATLKENDAPEVAVARLFASVRTNSAEYSDYGHFTNCLQPLPSEGEIRATAAEVQTLLVSGRKIEALQCAEEGQLWGPALVLAAQLGDQFYVDTIRKMALCQLVAGSPLRTLCLLIAGQPADAFSTDPKTDGGIPGVVNMSQQPVQAQPDANCMLEDWIENLAVITSNRTKDDELVLIHLGDCLWKERSNIIAAHICYLVAEANFEPYSDSARLCLIGADNWKHPRTYVSPEAIQRTEVFEYAKLLGNSQFTLLPFQPYKLIYAHMLAEVGRLSDSLKYCQSISKSLKTGRAPEVETWRQLVSSLEDRIKTHQQGGFSTNLAPGKLVGKLLNLFDSTAQRVVGGLPPPIPSTSSSGVQNGHHHQPPGPRVSTSQSTMAMSSLMPSASMEPMNQWLDEGNNRKTIHNRSVSEPDFGRSPRQVDPSKENSADSQTKASGDTSRLSRFSFGSQLLQKTVGLVLKSRGDKQAKLGDSNKFHYDEKLKRWVEEGVDPPVEEAALPPPPTMTTFQNGTSDYNLKNALKSEGPQSNGNSEFTGPMSMAHSPGIPAIPATSNQFSARGRIGVRARYVDTFNQGGGNPTNLLQSPAAPITKAATNPNPKFFVPTASPLAEQPVDTSDNTQLPTTDVKEDHSFSGVNSSFQFPHPSSAMSRQKFASMNNVSEARTATRRTASWAGNGQQGFSFSNRSELKPVGVGLGLPPSSLMPIEPALGMNDELQEVDL
ncbi:protein transport protein SEC16A homolog isoform X2 [Cynara cardunculus var. scolymus]|uniref:protein transport protein SEC16A homolog isoform X2 n=1 Tax=Cynara cardunculus var. scolymus TaxID=59895 RepID=UPI000D62FC21|nr:protein transport protein SEC16A homolog isoform X2 [Cynara cardunculus var. scolymus]